MAKWRPKAELVLSEEERVQLQSMARSRSLPSALAQRAKIVLRDGRGEQRGVSVPFCNQCHGGQMAALLH